MGLFLSSFYVCESLQRGEPVKLEDFVVFDHRDRGERLAVPSLPSEVTPPPLTVLLTPPERQFFLASGEQKPESEILKTAIAQTLIWHPDFGQEWKQAGEVFPHLQ